MSVVCLLTSGIVQAQSPAGVRFRRVAEPREGAFTVLVPADWKVSGGITRVNPLTSGGSGNAIAAKLDFTLEDASGKSKMRWLPEMMYADLRGMPAAPLFAQGSNYNGMTVMPVMDAATFLERVAFRYAHPSAASARIVERVRVPAMIEAYQGLVQQMRLPLQLRFDAAVISVEYTEGNARFEEKLYTGIQDMTPSGAGMWSNKETFLVRAPAGQMAAVAPILSVVVSSVELNPQWVMGEIRGQMERGEIARLTQQEIQRLDNEIVMHRQKTNSAIHHQMFKTLMGQEEYINPHTKKMEVGTNAWNHRWVDGMGNVFYTNNPNDDPNRGGQRGDWVRSPVAKKKIN